MAARADRERHAVRLGPQHRGAHIVRRSAAGDAGGQVRGIGKIPGRSDPSEVRVIPL
jgi:hypothetical protein